MLIIQPLLGDSIGSLVHGNISKFIFSSCNPSVFQIHILLKEIIDKKKVGYLDQFLLNVYCI